MPKYKPSDEEMDSSYGGQSSAPVGPPGASKEPSENPAEPKESVDQENAGEDSALVSNKILSPDGEPLKEGDEVVLKVVKNYGDESEIRSAPKKSGESEETSPQTSDENMASVGEDFAAMAGKE